jgi:hypothetical protein
VRVFITVAVLSVSFLAFALEPASARSNRVDSLPTKVLAKEAKKVVRNGGTFSVRHGDCKPYLKRLVYELVQRGFRPHGSYAMSQAIYIVRRESGFCPGAVNTRYSSWRQQAKGIAQWVPATQPGWINYKRLVSDPYYAVRVFVVTSDHGRDFGPWCSCFVG